MQCKYDNKVIICTLPFLIITPPTYYYPNNFILLPFTPQTFMCFCNTYKLNISQKVKTSENCPYSKCNTIFLWLEKENKTPSAISNNVSWIFFKNFRRFLKLNLFVGIPITSINLPIQANKIMSQKVFHHLH